MISCEYCNLMVSKPNYSKHKKTELCKNIKTTIEQFKNNYLIEINNLKQQLEESLRQNEKEKQKILTLEVKLNECIEKSEEYRKIVEKSATKSTKTVKNNYTHNNYLNLISQEPIKFSELPKQLKEVVNCESLMYNDNEFHNHIVDNILKDENGKDKVLCTDINRKNFSYKDELSGELISDPELEKLRVQLRNGSDIKIVKRDLLNKLIEEYEDTNIDPYVKFYEILKKLEFGGQFVEHVAKKTYVKSMMSV
jgi:hypothetical protein